MENDKQFCDCKQQSVKIKEESLKIKINLLMQNSNRLMIQFKSLGNTKLQNSITFSGLPLEEEFHCIQE
jgi:hypothetical protein